MKPDRLATVFAGQERPATEAMRQYIEAAPSSPSFALFKGDKLVSFTARENIENRTIEDIMMDLKADFDEYCAK